MDRISDSISVRDKDTNLSNDIKKPTPFRLQRGKHNPSHNPKRYYGHNLPIPKDDEKGFPLLQLKEFYFNFDDLIVRNEIKEQIEYLLTENKHESLLYSYGLKPKRKILFCGPPGTGKTLTSKILSFMLGYPMVYVLFDSILSSYLGQTATNLRKIFDFIEHGRWVVLFDEFDIIGKKRDDPYEHGEIKRVVNNFMQMIDNYEGDSVLIAATNHQHLLDSAIWRRFDEIIYFDIPELNLRERLFAKYLKPLRRSNELKISNETILRELASKTEGFTPSDIAQICEDALRRTIILNMDKIRLADIIWAIEGQKRRKSIIAKNF